MKDELKREYRFQETEYRIKKRMKDEFRQVTTENRSGLIYQTFGNDLGFFFFWLLASITRSDIDLCFQVQQLLPQMLMLHS